MGRCRVGGRVQFGRGGVAVERPQAYTRAEARARRDGVLKDVLQDPAAPSVPFRGRIGRRGGRDRYLAVLLFIPGLKPGLGAMTS